MENMTQRDWERLMRILNGAGGGGCGGVDD